MHKAKLIAISTPLGEIDHLSPEELIIYMARISSPSNQNHLDTSVKLLKYLLKHNHLSPFQMVTATFEIETTRAISRQLLRHRSLNFQEYSGRYAKMPEDPIVQECRMQDKTNRQSSNECESEALNKSWELSQKDLWQKSILLYKNALSCGIAKEVARSLLPEGMCKSNLYMTGTIRDIMFYLKQRLDPSTQKEHRDLAKSIRDGLSGYFPNIIEALNL